MANIKRANTSGITKSGVAIPDVPDAPTGVSATNVGTARAFNNGSATVAFTGAATGGTSTTFTATSTPGSFTASGAGSPLTVTGLQSATSYTFAVTGTNASATGPAGTSASITATTVPQAPTIGTATDGGTGTTVSVTFTAGATGGSAITTYTVTSSPGSITGTGASSPITVSGLTAATAYTFTVTATNANGTSTASSASNSVTPRQPSVAAYFASGSTLEGVGLTTIDKLTFSNDSKSTVTNRLAAQKGFAAAMANSGTAGYVAGGYAGSATSSIDKITFPGDSVSTISATLSATRGASAAAANSGTAGYVTGGAPSSGTPRYSSIEKLTFSGESRSTIAATIGATSTSLSGTANSGTAGYFAGGTTDGGTTSLTAIWKLTFSSDTRSTLSATLDDGRFALAAFANSGTAGYFGTGATNATGRQPIAFRTSNTTKLAFSNDTVTNVNTPMIQNSGYINYAAAANSGVAGYASGGQYSTLDNGIYKWTFSNDSKSTLSAVLSQVTTGHSGFADSGTL
jgi:hypothetical protein